jgi:hypothetical protein
MSAAMMWVLSTPVSDIHPAASFLDDSGVGHVEASPCLDRDGGAEQAEARSGR